MLDFSSSPKCAFQAAGPRPAPWGLPALPAVLHAPPRTHPPGPEAVARQEDICEERIFC